MAGTALGVPVVGTLIGALSWCRNWRCEKADHGNDAEDEAGVCTAKEEDFNDKKTFGKHKSKDNARPHRDQKNGGQKAEAQFD